VVNESLSELEQYSLVEVKERRVKREERKVMLKVGLN
jgi:hypothetical protein